jgi:hypothetical protein
MSMPISATKPQAAKRSTPGTVSQRNDGFGDLYLFFPDLFQALVDQLCLTFHKAPLQQQSLQRKSMMISDQTFQGPDHGANSGLENTLSSEIIWNVKGAEVK